MNHLIEKDMVASSSRVSSCRRVFIAAASSTVLALGLMASPAFAETCEFIGGPQFGGVEPSLAVNGTCTDPDYNEKTFVLDGTEQKTLDLPDGTQVAYTEVKGHFPAIRAQADLPAGITQSPTTVQHGVTWRFPEKRYWRNRFFQQTYPLELQDLNSVDDRFAFVTGGGYTVGITPGNPNVGYRVSAAAAKLAKSYANRFYGNTKRIYGYIYGQSGGGVQSVGIAEGTSGVWDGVIPTVIGTEGLVLHSFMWNAFYALGIPEEKRKAISDAAAPGSGQDIYAGLTGEERAVLDEFLRAGFPRHVLDGMRFNVATANQGDVRSYDPTYEDDFWSKPGYEGTSPPAYLTAAKVDGYAPITGLTRDAKGALTAVTFDPAAIPALGSVGASGLQFYVYGPDGTTRITKGTAVSLAGKLDGNTLKLEEGKSDPALLAALAIGTKIRINNRFVLACAFYPRHSILDNGNPGYNQYRNTDGTPKYVQRPKTPIPIPALGSVRTDGGVRQTGNLKTRTIIFSNLADGAAFPYAAGFYASLVKSALGPRTDGMFRIYYQGNSGHGAFLKSFPGKFGTSTVATGGVMHQALLDLAAWAEGRAPALPSTRFTIDGMTQVSVPAKASERGGLQPVVHLTVNGGDRVEVGINQPVNLVGELEMPPRAGKIVEYDWYLGGSDYKFEPVTKLPKALPKATVSRTASFPKPGEYVITLRTVGERSGVGGMDSSTPLINIDRVRVVVK